MTLVEKDAQKLIDLAAKHGLTLMIGHLLQHHPVFVKLKQIATDGDNR